MGWIRRAAAHPKRRFLLTFVVAFGSSWTHAQNLPASEMEKEHGGGKVEWRTGYHDAVRAASEAGKAVFIDFFAEWCGPCRLMDEQVFPDPEVASALGEFICLKVDVDSNPEVAFAYRIQGIPRYIVLNLHQQIIGDQIGYLPAAELISFLSDSKNYIRRKMESPAIVVSDRIPLTEAFSNELPVEGAGFEDLMEWLSDPDPNVRDQAEGEILMRDSRLVLPLAMDAMVDEYLGTRIAGWRIFQNLSPAAEIGFDPWAVRGARAEQADAIRDWVERGGGGSE